MILLKITAVEKKANTAKWSLKNSVFAISAVARHLRIACVMELLDLTNPKMDS